MSQPYVEFRRARLSAAQVLEWCGIHRPPVDIKRVIEALGARVEFVPNPGWSGALTQDADAATVWINSDESPLRQRFTMAHECAHLLLHEGNLFRDGNYWSDGSQKEVEANKYAADLLMPLAWVAELGVPCNFDSANLCRQFGVSSAAMEIRLAKIQSALKARR
jgi:Zn-dependent peptidase ImmA (M78 family)